MAIVTIVVHHPISLLNQLSDAEEDADAGNLNNKKEAKTSKIAVVTSHDATLMCLDAASTQQADHREDQSLPCHLHERQVQKTQKHAPSRK